MYACRVLLREAAFSCRFELIFRCGFGGVPFFCLNIILLARLGLWVLPLGNKADERRSIVS